MNEQVSYKNMKPYRTKAQKEEAKKTAYLAKDGTYRSNAPTSQHTDKCAPNLCVCR